MAEVKKYKGKLAKNQGKKKPIRDDMALDLVKEFNQRYEHLPFTCFLIDKLGAIIALNSAGVSQIGYTVAELKHTDIFSLFYWPNFTNKNQLLDWLYAQSKIDLVKEGNNQFISDYFGQICGKNNLVWFKVIPVTLSYVFSSPDNESQNLCLICQEVTNFYLTHKFYANFLTKLMQVSQDIILCLDDDGKMRQFSQAFLELSGYEAEELYGQNILAILDTKNSFAELKDWQWYQSLFTKEEKLPNGITEHSTAKFIQTIVCKNGAKIEIFWTVHGLKNSVFSGKWIWFGQTVFNYIPEVADGEQKIAVKPSLANFSEAVAIFDKKFRYVYVNSVMKEALNLQGQQVIGKTNQELSIPEDLNNLWVKNLTKVMQTGEAVEGEFLFPLGKNNLEKEIKLSSSKSHKNKLSKDFLHEWYQVCWLPLWGANNSVDWVFSMARKINRPVADMEKSLVAVPENSLFEYAQKTIEDNIQIYFENIDDFIKSAVSNGEISKNNLLLSLQILNKKLKREVANKQRLEKALQESQERLSLIVNTNADGLIILDKLGKILFVNPAAAAIFGRHKKDLIGTWLGRPIVTHEMTELEILLPNQKVAIAQMQVVEIPWSQLESYTHSCQMQWGNESELRTGLGQGTKSDIAYLGSLRDVTEQKQAFDRLLWMQQAIESASDAIAITNRTGQVLYQNPAFCQLFEYKDVEEINRRNPAPNFEVVTLSNYPKFLSNLLQHSPLISSLFTDKTLAEEVLKTVRQGKSWQGEVTMQSRTGKVMQIALKADAIANQPGHIIGLICTYTNVTERRQAEEMLRISWAQNRAMIETIPDTLCRISKDGTYLECSQNSEAKSSHNLANCVGKKCQEVLPPFLAKEQMAALAKALATKKVQVFEYQLVLPGEDGANRLYDYEARVAAIDDQEVLTMVRDVSDKAEAQRSLKESEERYRTLTETSQDMIFIFNRDTSINYVNSFAANKLSRTPEKLIGQSVRDVFPSPLGTELANKIYQVLRCKTQTTFEEKLELKYQPIWLHFSLVPLRNEAGILTAVLAVGRNITERVQAEAALKESQEKLRQSEQQLARTLATAPIGIATCDLHGEFKSVNPALCEMLGYPALSLRKMSLGDLVVESDRSGFQTWIRALATGDQIQSQQLQKEYSLICKDGRELVAMIRIALVRDPENQPLQLVATIEDITQRKRSQEQLLLLSKAVESASDAIAITDCHGRSTYHNPAFVQLFGFSASELTTAGGLPILYRDPNIALEIFNTILQAGSWQGEIEMFSAQGVIRQIFLRADAIQNATGEIIAFLGIYRDITESKQAIDALAESEERFRTLADTAPVLIWLADRYGSYTFFNQTWLQYTGRSLEQEQGQGWMSQIHPEDFDRCLQEYFRAIEQGNAFRLLYRLRRKDGEYRWLLNTGVPRKTPAGHLAGYIGSCVDISDRKELEEQLAERAKQLEKSNAELEQFAYVASHDLQEPLRTIASYTQLLAKRYQGQLDEKADKYIHYVVDGAQRMQTLIDDLLTYSRVSTRGQEFRPVNCQAIFEQAIAHLRVAIRQADAEIFLDPSCVPLPTVLGDETQLLQLFQNLISNAIKYRQPEVRPIIKISAQRCPNYWLFAIQDNGIGIDPQYHQRIFLIFQRLHTRNEYPGTGIGLAVCHKIVERHQGRIWVESQLGQGSTFYFTLPDILE